MTATDILAVLAIFAVVSGLLFRGDKRRDRRRRSAAGGPFPGPTIADAGAAEQYHGQRRVDRGNWHDAIATGGGPSHSDCSADSGGDCGGGDGGGGGGD